MRNNETGEFELVVGNRQLLSGFFIVVLLFAVAFAMGYVVGQNSPRSAKVSAEGPAPTSAGEPQRPAPVTAQPQQTAAVVPADNPPAPSSDTPPQPTTQPATEGGVAPAAAPAAQAGAPAEPALPPGTEAPPAPAGSYWQVAAVSQPDVNVFYKTLKDRGFPTYLELSPKGLVRVLVGPYKDRDAMGKAKDDIEKLGFKPIRK
jgi:cell division septation protein DedD